MMRGLGQWGPSPRSANVGTRADTSKVSGFRALRKRMDVRPRSARSKVTLSGCQPE
jgi:hypothetical protein